MCSLVASRVCILNFIFVDIISYIPPHFLTGRGKQLPKVHSKEYA